jgi:hypothetical protein
MLTLVAIMVALSSLAVEVLALGSILFQRGGAASGTFDLLTYNIAGLPQVLTDNGVSGDKATNAGTIGSKFAQYDYDVIHVQEARDDVVSFEVCWRLTIEQDFNYHSYLYATDDHPHRTATSGPVPLGSGLNTMSNFNWNVLDRITWDHCFINEADCLTPKGFTLMRLQLAAGVEVDLYNLHADAG